LAVAPDAPEPLPVVPLLLLAAPLEDPLPAPVPAAPLLVPLAPFDDPPVALELEPAPVRDPPAPDAAPLPDPAVPLPPAPIRAFISMNCPALALFVAELLVVAPVPAPPVPAGCTHPMTVTICCWLPELCC